MTKDFDVFGFLEGRTFPTEIVKLYVDDESALKATNLIQEKEQLDEGVPAEKRRITEIDKELKSLAKTIDETALRAHLRGKPAGEASRILSEESTEDAPFYLVSLYLEKVETPDGKTQEGKFTVEDARRFRQLLPAQAWGALNEAITKLVISSAAFDQMADAGFFPKS